MLWLVGLLIAADPVTAKNWEHHPEIEAVRKIVAEVDAARGAQKLRAKTRKCEFESRTLWVDDRGVARFYGWDAGSEDSADAAEYYYDASGRLRFLHMKGGAVPNAARESRLWFDEKGRLLWHRHSFSGQGMDLDPTDTPDLVVRDPKAHYASLRIHGQGSDACEETDGGT